MSNTTLLSLYTLSIFRCIRPHPCVKRNILGLDDLKSDEEEEEDNDEDEDDVYNRSRQNKVHIWINKNLLQQITY